MNHLWRWKAFTIPGPLSSYGVGGPSWGSLFTIPGSYKPGMAFDSSLARLLGTLLGPSPTPTNLRILGPFSFLFNLTLFPNGICPNISLADTWARPQGQGVE
jgi:hypothetical protein